MKGYKNFYILAVDIGSKFQRVSNTPDFLNRSSAFKYIKENGEELENYPDLTLVRREVSDFYVEKIRM